MGDFIYKPQTSKGPVFLHPGGQSSPPTITLPSGQVITGRYLNTVDEGGGANSQYVFPTSVLGQQGAKLTFNGQTQVLGNTNMSYRGNGIGALQESSKGAIGSPVTGGGGAFGPVPFGGGFGFGPANLTGLFPNPYLTQFNPVTYNPIQAAPYKFTDVSKFAKQFGQFQRNENKKNFAQAKNFALDSLDTELQSLQHYTPAAAALKRSETSIDNQFNQQERTAQLQGAIPDQLNDLDRIASDARSYASGRAPDDVTDRALELNVRSAAADRANAGGFGASSSVSRKASDLMSADQRINLSLTGENLLAGNVNQQAALKLAPTEYSNAGSQVSVTPPVSASQLISSNMGLLSQLNSIPATTALGTTVQQEQFKTNLEQGTRTFNAGNQLQSDEFNSSGEFQESATNAGIQNQFALDKFGYQVGLAGAYAGAAQTDTNTQVGLQQQAQAQQNYQSGLGAAQSAGTFGAIAGAVGTVGSIIGGGGLLAAPVSPSSVGGVFQGVGTPDNFITGGSGGGGGSVTRSSGGGSGSSNGGTSGSGGNSDSGTDTGTSGISGGGGNESSQVFDSPALNGRIGRFEESTGVNLRSAGIAASTGPGSPGNPTVGDLVAHGDSTLRAAGITSTPEPGTTQVGVDENGQPIYSSVGLLKSSNLNSGSQLVSSLSNAVTPFGALSDEEANKLQSIGEASSNIENLRTLEGAYQGQDESGFIGSALKAMGISSPSSIAKDQGENLRSVSSAYSAQQLYQNWGHMSPAQKTLGLAALGTQGFRSADGKPLSEIQVVKPVTNDAGDTVRPGLKVGEGLELLKDGYNVYSLVKNWDQINSLSGVLSNGSLNVSGKSLASLAAGLDLIGYGPEGSAVKGVSESTLQHLQATPTPQFGVGSIAIPASKLTPAGYSRIATRTDGTQIIVPQANGASATSGLLNTAAGTSSAGEGAAIVYRSWPKTQNSGGANGALGGSQMIAGLSKLSQTNPYTLGSLATASLVGSKDPKASIFGNSKDDGAVLDSWRKSGILNSNFELQSVTGQKVNLKSASGKIDPNSDLSVVAGMGGVTLSRILGGGASPEIDRVGAKIAEVSRPGDKLTPESYRATMLNQRAFFSQAGIKSKSDGIQLLNQAYAEKRINETQHVIGRQSLDLVFDKDSFAQAQRLMGGREAGVEAAKRLGPVNAGKFSQPMVEKQINPQVERQKASVSQIISRNKAKFGARVAA